ncbi:hypothetical protein [Micromonospora sp. CPCC 205561]|uniref:hypothetical protein n=1 Tax=Micromonospora sp. CPCC 205561 TaxID=3122407 RepID=UPI002FEE830E
MVLAPFVLLIVPMAVVNGNPEVGFIVRLVALALLGSAVVETFGLLLGRPTDEWRHPFRPAGARDRSLYVAARLVAVTGIVASLVGAYVGRGTIVAQVSGELPTSPVAAMTALFAGWGAFAFALLVVSHLRGQVSARRLHGWLALLVLAQVVVVAMTAISAPLLGFLSFLGAAGLICGIFRIRYLLVVVAVVFLVWPTVFEYRNAIRADRGVAVSEQVTATDRLRLDLQLAAVAPLDVPADVVRPGLVDYVRYGLVPRALDEERPPISTGQEINQYLGGGATSAYTFLSMGNVYFFHGPLGVVAFYAGWAAVVMALLRMRGGPGPVRLSLLCFVLAGPLLWSSTYPDSSISVIQQTVSAVPVLLLLRATRRRPHRRSSAVSLAGTASTARPVR